MPSVYCDTIEEILWSKIYSKDFTLDSNVDIWRIMISSSLHLIHHLSQLLSSDERARASRYHQKKDRQRFAVSRIALRFLLGKYSNINPEKIEFAVGGNKKPFMQNVGAPALHYNISHSGDWILIAFSDEGIGADIEMIDEVFSYSEILHQNFTQQEISFITNGNHQSENFYLLWTRKEALLKATSKGIDSDLPFIPSLDGRHNADQEMIGSDKDFFVSSFKIADKYIGSVGYASGNKKLRFRDINNFLRSEERS
jgi:4'-phosphopantetheinyl transferase